MTGNTYIVFGASGGVGHQLCLELAAKDTVIACARDESKLESLQNQANITPYVCDVSNLEQVLSCVEQVLTQHTHIHGLVNCAGSIMLKPAHLITEDDWQQTITANLNTAFNVVHAAGKLLQKPASVVLMSSAAASIGLPNHEAISAAKAGINGLVLAAASSYASRQLRFNAVAPGLVETPLTKTITDSEKAREISLKSHPIGRLGKPSDCTAVIRCLLSSENSWITGQIWAVDGGLSNIKQF